MLPCQLFFRTDFVVTIMSDCLLFGYCSLISSHRVITSAVSSSIKPILPSLPFPSFCRCLSQGCSQSPAQQGWTGLSGGKMKMHSLADGVTLFLETCQLSTSVMHEFQPWLWLMARHVRKAALLFGPSQKALLLFWML